mgnify:CR=1 FL=1
MPTSIPAVGVRWTCQLGHHFQTLLCDDAKILVPLCPRCSDKSMRKRAITGVLLTEVDGEVITAGPEPSEKDALKAMRDTQWRHLSALADAARPHNAYGEPLGVRCTQCVESHLGHDPQCVACAAIAFVRETEALAGLGEKAA